MGNLANDGAGVSANSGGASAGSARATDALYEPLRSEPQITSTLSCSAISFLVLLFDRLMGGQSRYHRQPRGDEGMKRRWPPDVFGQPPKRYLASRPEVLATAWKALMSDSITLRNSAGDDKLTTAPIPSSRFLTASLANTSVIAL